MTGGVIGNTDGFGPSILGSSPSPLTKFNNMMQNFNNQQELPDAYWHQKISFLKSAIRIFGYGLLFYSVPIAAGVLILSELIGIIEELV